jgi:hypothetical protein
MLSPNSSEAKARSYTRTAALAADIACSLTTPSFAMLLERSTTVSSRKHEPADEHGLRLATQVGHEGSLARMRTLAASTAVEAAAKAAHVPTYRRINEMISACQSNRLTGSVLRLFCRQPTLMRRLDGATSAAAARNSQTSLRS